MYEGLRYKVVDKTLWLFLECRCSIDWGGRAKWRLGRVEFCLSYRTLCRRSATLNRWADKLKNYLTPQATACGFLGQLCELHALLLKVCSDERVCRSQLIVLSVESFSSAWEFGEIVAMKVLNGSQLLLLRNVWAMLRLRVVHTFKPRCPSRDDTGAPCMYLTKTKTCLYLAPCSTVKRWDASSRRRHRSGFTTGSHVYY